MQAEPRALTVMTRLIGALMLLFAVIGNASAQTTGHNLTGTVFGGGSPLPNTLVQALSGSTVAASMTTDSAGHYQLVLTDGTYALHVVPPVNSGFGEETIQNIVISGADRTYDVILLSAAGSIRGTVRGLGGNPLAGVNVNVYNQNFQFLGSATTASDGTYSVQAGSGLMRVQFYGASMMPGMPGSVPPSPYAPSSWNSSATINVSGPTTYDVNLKVVRVDGIVKGADGATIANASISASSGFNDWANNVSFSSNGFMSSASDGSYSMLLLAGNANFTVNPPSGTTYTPLSESLALNADAHHDLILAMAVAISGTVRGLGANPLAGVNVNVYNQNFQFLGSATTGTDGRYSVQAAPGSIRLQFYGASMMPGMPGSVPPSPYAPNSWNSSATINVSGPTTYDVNLKVLRVDGIVKGADGATIANASISASSGFNDWANNVSFSSNGFMSSGSDGSYSMLLLAGNANFTVNPPSGTTYTPLSESLALNADAHHDLILAMAVAISGTVRGLGANPLAGVNVNVYNQNFQFLGSATTGTDGRYSVQAAPGSIRLQFYGASMMPGMPGSVPPSPYAPNSWNSSATINVSGPTTYDVSLDVVTVAGITTDSNGAGVPGVSISASSGFNDWAKNVSFSSNAFMQTGSDGAYAFRLLRGNAQFTINPPSQSGFLPTALNSVQLNGDLTQRIILQHPDLVAPQIVAGPVVVHLSDTSVSISWTTNEAATSRVEFGIGGLTSVINNTALTTTHEITLTGLATSSTYQFRVGSTDGSNNGPTWSDVGTFSTQAPPGDITPPVIISGPTLTAINQTSAIVQWTTDEPSTSSAEYGATETLGLTASAPVGAFTRSHSIRLSGLTAQTQYFVRVTSADPDGNSTTSGIVSFTTLAVPDTTPPVITSGPSIASKSDTRIIVTWTTNEPATSGVSFNDGVRFDVVSDDSLVINHRITLSGLRAATTYTIIVSSKDAAGNGPTVSAPVTATTDPTPDTTAPVIADVAVSNITATSATVTWSTNELSTSAITYGVTSGLPDTTQDDATPVLTHRINLTGLRAATRYYFVVKSTDASGNIGASAETSFTSASANDLPPTAPSGVSAPGLTNAQSFRITWIASQDDVGVVFYDVIRDGNVVQTVTGNVTEATESNVGDGSYVYAIRARDAAGNSATSETVNVLVDRTPPTINASNMPVEATGPSTTVNYQLTVTDNVDRPVSIQCTPASGSAFAIGSTAVSCTATDAATNTKTATFAVEVRDTTPPFVSVPGTIIREATGSNGAIATFATTANDLVDGAIVASCNYESGAVFGVGSTTVRCTAVDAAHNEGSATFEVVVRDTTPPSVTVPAAMVAEATGPNGAVVMFSSSASDLVSGATTCTPSSGSTFALGRTLVTCSATDAASNVGRANFTIDVRDTTPPVVKVPADMRVEATSASGAVATFVVTATDLVSDNLGTICTPASGALFAIGPTAVSCSATDGAGNTGRGSFTITVSDTTPPAIVEIATTAKTLWPPDHRMVPITLTVTAIDAVDPAPRCRVASITSNEAIDGLGDGDTAPDWVIAGALSIQLRAERAGNGSGRIYTINVECSDAANNVARKATTVTVPKSQSR